MPFLFDINSAQQDNNFLLQLKITYEATFLNLQIWSDLCLLNVVLLNFMLRTVMGVMFCIDMVQCITLFDLQGHHEQNEAKSLLK